MQEVSCVSDRIWPISTVWKKFPSIMALKTVLAIRNPISFYQETLACLHEHISVSPPVVMCYTKPGERVSFIPKTIR